MKKIMCIKCEKEIAATGRKFDKYYCRSCGGFYHGECSSPKNPSECPICTELSCDSFNVITEELLTYMADDDKRTSSFVFESTPPTFNEETKIENAQKIDKKLRNARLGSLLAGPFLMATGPAWIYGAFMILQSSKYNNPLPNILLFLLLLGLGLGTFKIGYKTIRGGIKVKGAHTARETAKMFYEEALRGDPLEANRLIQLLHPDTVLSLNEPWDKLLQNEWYAARRETGSNSGPSIIKTTELPTDNPDCVDVVVTAAVTYYNLDKDYLRLKKRLIYQFNNRAVRIGGKWKLLSALPGQMKPMD